MILQTLVENLPTEIVAALIGVGGVLAGILIEQIRTVGERQARLRQLHAEVYLDKRANKLVELFRTTFHIQRSVQEYQSLCQHVYNEDFESREDFLDYNDSALRDRMDEVEANYGQLLEQWWTVYYETLPFLSGYSLNAVKKMGERTSDMNGHYLLIQKLLKRQTSKEDLRKANEDFYKSYRSANKALSQALTITRDPLKQYDRRDVSGKLRSIISRRR